MKFPRSKKAEIIGAIGAFAVLLTSFAFIFIFQAMLGAFVISTLWGWYVVPFLSTPHMSLPIAFGISLLVSYMMPVSHCKDEKELSEHIAYAIAVPLSTLLLGYVGTLFM
jgi:hypothetical protein